MQTLKQVQFEIAEITTPLQKALLLAGVPIYDNNEVDKFKKRERLREQIRNLRASIVLAIPLFAGAVLLHVLLPKFVVAALASVVLAGTGTALLLLACLAVFDPREFRWETISPFCSTVENIIPPTVWRDIRRIQGYYPRLFSDGCDFQMEYLGSDPLIYAEDFDGSRYYFAMWK